MAVGVKCNKSAPLPPAPAPVAKVSTEPRAQKKVVIKKEEQQEKPAPRVKRNPFQPQRAKASAPKARSLARKKPTARAGLVLQGILWRNGEFKAVINNKVFGLHENNGRIKILDIDSKSVRIRRQRDQKEITLRLQK